MKLRNKVCIITGSSSGIGAACALALAKHGAKIMLHGRKEPALQQVAEQCIAQGLPKENVSYVLGDITDEDTLTRIRDVTLDKFGAIDILFNNAGYTDPNDLPIHRGGTVKALDDMFKIYVKAPYLLVQKCIPALEESKGVVVNCSSGYSKIADPNFTGYSTMKAAMDMLTQVLAMSLGMRGIRVNCLNPGPVPTEIFNRRFGEGFNDVAMGGMAMLSPLERRLATPDEIANIFMFLASEESASVTGQQLFCDMGATLQHQVMDLQ